MTNTLFWYIHQVTYLLNFNASLTVFYKGIIQILRPSECTNQFHFSKMVIYSITTTANILGYF